MKVNNPSIRVPRLRKDQLDILAHPAKTKVVSCGRRYGKTVCGGVAVVNAANQGGRVAWVVPEYSNAKPLWEFLIAATTELVKAKLVRIDKNEEHIVEFKQSGGFIRIYSADNPNAMRGDNFHLVVVDEAAFISSEIYYNVIQPTVADTDGDVILFSTPFGFNYFHTEWIAGYREMQRNPNTNVQACFQAPTTANPMPTIQRWAERRKSKLPRRVYEQEILAKFVGDGALFSNVEDCVLRSPPPLSARRSISIGVDLAKSIDNTEFIVVDLQSSRVLEIQTHHGVDYSYQLDCLRELAYKWDAEYVVIEQNNQDFFIEMAERVIPNIYPFHTNNKSKAKIIHALMKMFESKQIGIPDDPDLIGQLMAFQSTTLASNLVRYAAPNGQHDDKCIALALAFSAQESELAFETEVA
jgi:phage terminase large subunit-like protein